jgi:ribosome-associated protein
MNMRTKRNSSVKEQALHREQSATQTLTKDAHNTATDERGAENTPLDGRIAMAVRAASDKKAIDLIALDLREIASFTDYFLIASGTNTRQVQAISDEIVEQLKRAGTRAARVEGYSTAEWVLLDYGDFIVHVFENKARRFYDLERLWREAARIALPPDLTGDAESNTARNTL